MPTTAPNAASWVSAAGRSLDWLDGHIERFAPLRNGLVDEFGLKAFAEFALIYAYLHQWDHLPFRNRLPKWKAFLAAQCERPAFVQTPRKQPAVAVGYLIPYLMLRSTGYRFAYHEDTLGRLERWNLLRSVELVPYRVLEREHAFWKSGWLPTEPDWRSLFDATTLGRPPSPLGFDDEASYSVTHTLFYLTDFGNRRPTLSASEMEQTVDLVECLLVHYWRIGHWDLVGELLVNLNCLGRSSLSPIRSAAAHAYMSAWGHDGAVPAKRGMGDGDGSNAATPEDRFRLCYHSTLVAVLYFATAMSAAQPGGTEPLR